MGLRSGFRQQTPAGAVAGAHAAVAPTAGRSLLLVANLNASGVGGARDVVHAAERELRSAGARIDAVRTESPAELEALLAEAGERRVVVLGGDGSLHLIANGIHLPELALLPAGRANNIARSLGIPRDLRAAAALAVEGRARPLDVLETRSQTGRYVAVEGVSVGYLAQARTRYDAPNSASVRGALGAGLRALWKFRPFTVVLDVDERREELRIGQMFAANLPLYAFGLRVAPGADPRDGRLDAVALSPRGRASLLALAPRVRRGAHERSRLTRTWRATRLRIDPLGASPVVADSVDLGSSAVEITVRSGGLRLVAP